MGNFREQIRRLLPGNSRGPEMGINPYKINMSPAAVSVWKFNQEVGNSVASVANGGELLVPDLRPLFTHALAEVAFTHRAYFAAPTFNGHDLFTTDNNVLIVAYEKQKADDIDQAMHSVQDYGVNEFRKLARITILEDAEKVYNVYKQLTDRSVHPDAHGNIVKATINEMKEVGNGLNKEWEYVTGKSQQSQKAA